MRIGNTFSCREIDRRACQLHGVVLTFLFRMEGPSGGCFGPRYARSRPSLAGAWCQTCLICCALFQRRSFERSIDVLVSRIPRKIEPDPRDATMIKTMRSSGYMLTPGVDACASPANASSAKLFEFFDWTC